MANRAASLTASKAMTPSAAAEMAPQHGRKFDCLSGFETWQTDWAEPKQKWCCTNFNMGCGADAPGTQIGFDCSKDFHHWETVWSPGKKGWCCDHMKIGCAS